MEPDDKQRHPSRKDAWLWIILAVFIVAAIAGMLVIDDYGQSRMGDPAAPHDAADH